jgi:hypothetical protein
MVGDLNFFSQMLGKEGFDSNWCSHCQLNRNEWAVGCEFTIVESTLESIRLLAAESTDAIVRSCDELPMFDSIGN